MDLAERGGKDRVDRRGENWNDRNRRVELCREERTKWRQVRREEGIG